MNIKRPDALWQAFAAGLLFMVPLFSTAQNGSPTSGPPPGTRTGFTINVQVITKSEFAGNGVGVVHQRSYNNEHGIDISATVHPDGTFQGTGSGTDSGSADVVAHGISGETQFGNNLSITASGTISPDDCSAIPCLPGSMHLVLSGASSPQTAVAHARAGNMEQTVVTQDPSGSGTIILDMPAHVGAMVEQLLFSNGLTTSMLIVTITAETVVPPHDPEHPPQPQRPPGLPLSSSNNSSSAGGSSGGSSSGGGGGSSGGGGGTGGGGAAGIVVLGADAPVSSPVMILINEAIHTADIPVSTPITHVAINVNESIHTADSLPTAAGLVAITVNETIQVGDGIASAAAINLAETVHVADVVATPAAISIAKTVHVTDSPMPPP